MALDTQTHSGSQRVVIIASNRRVRNARPACERRTMGPGFDTGDVACDVNPLESARINGKIVSPFALAALAGLGVSIGT